MQMPVATQAGPVLARIYQQVVDMEPTDKINTVVGLVEMEAVGI
jgi:hypothetical protein